MFDVTAYTDPAQLDRERAAIFARAWVCVGRVEDLPRPGAWLRAPIGAGPGVVVVRGEDGALRAFHAVCPHRGYPLVERDEGAGARITCPYHGFAFELDGRACAETADLSPVRVAEAHGFVFVTLHADAPPLAEALGELPPWIGRAALDRLKRARRVAYDVAANWKIVVENFQESLHFPTVHPALEALTPSSQADTWMPAAGDRGPWLGGIMRIVERAETVSVSGRRSGRPWLVPEEDRRVVHDAMRFPNLLTSLQPDYLLTFAVFPVAPDRTRVVACTYVHEEAPDDALEDVLAFWSRVYDEDREACERQQLGLSSPAARPPAYTDVEEGSLAFDRMVLRALDEAAPRPAAPPSPAPAAPAPAASRGGGGARLCGIWGHPYLDLSPFLDTSSFPELDREITLGLARVETSYTGGTLKWMGVCAPWVNAEAHYPDAMHLLAQMSREDFLDFVSLGHDDPSAFDPDRRAEYAFGDETDRPFTLAQMRFLKMRLGAYFLWKVCYHLLENERWEDKHSGEGKDFTEEARRVFPKTIAFLESLPMTEMGRVVIFGLEAHDHAPAHRDSEPGRALSIAQSLNFEPGHGARPKRFYLKSPDGSREVTVDAPIYWFNDMDWHGVHADPWFRYSIRVDGVFDPDFLEHVRREVTRRR